MQPRFHYIALASLVLLFGTMTFISVQKASNPIHPQTVTPATATQRQRAQLILETRCSACHVMPRPTDHPLSEWPAILNRMAPKAGLSNADKTLLLHYIQSTLKPTSGHVHS
jgi:hypothetical protein